MKSLQKFYHNILPQNDKKKSMILNYKSMFLTFFPLIVIAQDIIQKDLSGA